MGVFVVCMCWCLVQRELREVAGMMPDACVQAGVLCVGMHGMLVHVA